MKWVDVATRYTRKRHGRVSVLALATLLSAGWFPCPILAATRVLLVGVSEYTDTSITSPAGAANDVTEMRSMLVDRFGLEDSQVRTLVGKAATRAAILDSLSNWLLKNAAKNDELLFYYSGHGSNRPDENGDETDDGLDEVLCPSDYVQATGANGIIDDELGEILPHASPANLVVMIDACHSGTATKSVGDRLFDLPLARTGRTQARYLPPPRSSGTKSIVARHWNSKGITVARDITAPTLSACRDYQRAVSTKFMIGGKLVDHGAFTFTLLQGLSGAADADGDKALSLAELDDFVERGLRNSAYQFEQQPELLVRSGDENRKFLGAVLRDRPVELTRLGGNRCRINIGAMDGMPPGGKVQIALQDRGIKPQLAVLESADAHSAVVRLEDKPAAKIENQLESNEPIPVAIAPASQLPDEIILRVWVGSFFEGEHESLPPRSVLDALGRVEGVKIVRGEEQADRYVIGEYAGSRLKVAIALRSERIVKVIEGTEGEVARELTPAIENERLKHVLVCMQDPGGARRVSMRTADDRSAYAIREKGKEEHLELQVEVPADGYLTIFDVDSEGKFNCLFPNNLHPECGVTSGPLHIPPRGAFQLPIQAPSGRDMIKVIWSQAPMPTPEKGTKSIGNGMVRIDSTTDAINCLASLQKGLSKAVGTKGFVPEAAPAGSFGADLGWSCDTIFIDTFDEE